MTSWQPSGSQRGDQEDRVLTRRAAKATIWAVPLAVVAVISGIVIGILQLQASKAQSGNSAPASAQPANQLYQQITSGAPTISDTLSGPSSNAWELADGYCSFGGNHYNVAQGLAGFRTQCRLLSPSFQDFAVEVNVQISEGDLAGLAFYVSQQDKVNVGYRFVLSPNGTWALNQANGNDPITLASGTSDNARTGYNQTNTLMVIVQDGTAYGYINGSYVTETGVDDTTSGLLATYVFDATQTTQAAFSNIRIWSL